MVGTSCDFCLCFSYSFFLFFCLETKEPKIQARNDIQRVPCFRFDVAVVLRWLQHFYFMPIYFIWLIVQSHRMLLTFKNLLLYFLHRQIEIPVLERAVLCAPLCLPVSVVQKTSNVKSG